MQEFDEKKSKIDLRAACRGMNIPQLEILEFKARLGIHLETQKFGDEYDASK